MAQPIVIAYHLVWTAYGWWLPNDPRGSGSREVRRDVIAELGEVHYGRKKIQSAGRIVGQFYKKATDPLKHPLPPLEGTPRTETANAFEEAIQTARLTCYALALMPHHSHNLIR